MTVDTRQKKPAQTAVWSVYLLECADTTLYCGVTTDLSRRLDQHNGLLPGGARYTRSRRPVTLKAAVRTDDKTTAFKIEAMIKRLPRAKKLSCLAELSLQLKKPRQERNLSKGPDGSASLGSA